jgi:hypothetical protein
LARALTTDISAAVSNDLIEELHNAFVTINVSLPQVLSNIRKLDILHKPIRLIKLSIDG